MYTHQNYRVITAFSLIELMVVIAIIAILATVALPSYKDYVTKSKLTSGLAVLERLKSQSTEYYSINGAFPSLTDLNKNITDYATESVSWGNMGASGWAGGDAVNPYVEIQYNTDTVSGQTAPRLAFVATLSNNSVKWTCYTYNIATVDSSINTKFLPGDCVPYP